MIKEGRENGREDLKEEGVGRGKWEGREKRGRERRVSRGKKSSGKGVGK